MISKNRKNMLRKIGKWIKDILPTQKELDLKDQSREEKKLQNTNNKINPYKNNKTQNTNQTMSISEVTSQLNQKKLATETN